MRTATVVLVAVVAAVAAAETPYTNKFDNIDVDKILKNDRILTSYVKCLLDEGSCTPEGRELKRTLPDALKTDCQKCSEKQRVGTDKVIRHMHDKRRSDWDRLVKKYDPKGEFRHKYEARFANPGVKKVEQPKPKPHPRTTKPSH